MPPGGYGVGLFDSKGPEQFADAIKKITSALTGAQSGFTNFGSAASKTLQGMSDLVDKLTKKLSDLQKQANQSFGGGGGGGGGGRAGAGAQAGGGSGGTGAAGGGLWTPSSARGNAGGFNQGPLDTGQGTQPDGSAVAAQLKDQWAKMKEGTADDAKALQGSSMVSSGNGGGINWGAAAGSMIPAAAGALANSVQQGAVGNLIAASIQGRSMGMMLGPAYGMTTSRQQQGAYVLPKGTLAQNPQDFAQSNYYMATYMGANPFGGNTVAGQNAQAFNRGANQLMTLMPGMTRQQAMTTQNQMQQPGVLNAGLMFGLNFKPGGKAMDTQSQYGMIYQKLFAGFPGGKPTGDQFQSYMAPGGPGENNLAALGVTPGSDAYVGFMQYAQTRIGLAAQHKPMPADLGTKAGAKAAGLDTPATSQLYAQSSKSRMESQLEPGLGAASKNLNDAANALFKAVTPLSSLGGGIIGKLLGSGKGLLGGVPGLSMVGSIGGHLPGVGGIIKSIFQQGGEVPGNGPQLAVVHGGEFVLTKEDVEKMKGKKGPHGSGAGAPLAGLKKGGGGGHGGAADSALDMLASKPSDIATTSLGMLLSPPPAGSPLAALTKAGGLGAGKTAAPAQTGGKGNAGQSRGADTVAAMAAMFGGGAYSGAQGGLWVNPATGQLTATGAALAAGAPGAATGTAGPTSSNPWKYKSAGVGPIDLSGMFAGSGTPTQTSDGSGSGAGGSGGTGSGPPTTLTGSGNAQQAYNYFLGKGLKDYMAAGILGNLAQESGINPGSAQAGGPGRGIAQWSVGGRWDTLVAWAKAANRDPNSLSTQLDFLWNELTGTEAGSLAALKGTANVQDATTVFEQKYERAGSPAMASRLKYAQNILASKGAGYARGTQLVSRTQLALLHRGEGVVPAADNYSSTPYNKGGSVGSSSIVQLNFKPGAVVLQVPASADMDSIAKQFVAAISKPQNLTSVRST